MVSDIFLLRLYDDKKSCIAQTSVDLRLCRREQGCIQAENISNYRCQLNSGHHEIHHHDDKYSLSNFSWHQLNSTRSCRYPLKFKTGASIKIRDFDSYFSISVHCCVYYAAAAHSIPFDIWFIIYGEIYLAISLDESISSLEYLLQQTAVFHCMEYLLWNPWKHSSFWFPLVEARCINIKSPQMSATFNSLR